MAVRSKSSKAWLHEHVNDHYVHMAQKDGYRARAAYKLLEINQKDKLIKSGTVLADLGSAPGRWSYVYGRLSDANARDVIAGASAYAAAPDGIVPWRSRPEIFRKQSLARIPPIAVVPEAAE